MVGTSCCVSTLARTFIFGSHDHVRLDRFVELEMCSSVLAKIGPANLMGHQLDFAPSYRVQNI